MDTSKSPMNAENLLPWRQVLKRAGLVLIVFGAIDIAYMIYCITHGIGYRSSFNIFAVVAGVHLVKGNLRATNIIAWFAAFFLTGFAGLLIVFPMNEPIGLWSAKFHTKPIQTSVDMGIGILIAVLVYWIYRQLTLPQVQNALQETGVKARKPWTAVAAGVGLMTLLGIGLQLMLHGEDAQKAITMAKDIDGAAFNYTVTSINISNGHVIAFVTAYDSNEIRSERVEFDE